ncbi:unnamed protein product, partial [Vitis vinifera]
MWRLKIADGGNDPYIFSTNNFVGRQIWEFDPDYGTPKERAKVEAARENFWKNQFRVKPSSDLLCIFFSWQFWTCSGQTGLQCIRYKFLREKNFKQTIPQMKASDGHWPAENAGPLFLLPPLVIYLYITRHLDPIFLGEYRKEILCFIYCHQNEDGEWGFHVEGHNTKYCTVFNYICMSIIREGSDGGQGNACLRGQKWILDHGGATSIPSWGTWLLILGLFEWA